MHCKNIAIGLGMTLGVQLVPGAWVRSGDYVVPNRSYTLSDNGSGNRSGGGSGGSGFSGGSSGGSRVFGGETTPGCGGTVANDGTVGTLITEDDLNDALPYAWAKKFWLCSCPFSLEGSGLYWDTRPLVMCMF